MGLLLGLYPIVVDAVNVYKATKTGRAATSLIRKLKIEEVIYRQFVYKLLAPNVQGDDVYRLNLNQEPPDLGQAELLNQKLRIRLGSETADLVLEILREIESLLRDLNAELSSISRGMVICTCSNPFTHFIVCYEADVKIGSIRQISDESKGSQVQPATVKLPTTTSSIEQVQ